MTKKSKQWLREVKADVEMLKSIHPADWKSWDWASAPETIDSILLLLEIQTARIINIDKSYKLGLRYYDAKSISYSDDDLKRAKTILYGRFL